MLNLNEEKIDHVGDDTHIRTLIDQYNDTQEIELLLSKIANILKNCSEDQLHSKIQLICDKIKTILENGRSDDNRKDLEKIKQILSVISIKDIHYLANLNTMFNKKHYIYNILSQPLTEKRLKHLEEMANRSEEHLNIVFILLKVKKKYPSHEDGSLEMQLALNSLYDKFLAKLSPISFGLDNTKKILSSNTGLIRKGFYPGKDVPEDEVDEYLKRNESLVESKEIAFGNWKSRYYHYVPSSSNKPINGITLIVLGNCDNNMNLASTVHDHSVSADANIIIGIPHGIVQGGVNGCEYLGDIKKDFDDDLIYQEINYFESYFASLFETYYDQLKTNKLVIELRSLGGLATMGLLSYLIKNPGVIKEIKGISLFCERTFDKILDIGLLKRQPAWLQTLAKNNVKCSNISIGDVINRMTHLLGNKFELLVVNTENDSLMGSEQTGSPLSSSPGLKKNIHAESNIIVVNMLKGDHNDPMKGVSTVYCSKDESNGAFIKKDFTGVDDIFIKLDDFEQAFLKLEKIMETLKPPLDSDSTDQYQLFFAFVGPLIKKIEFLEIGSVNPNRPDRQQLKGKLKRYKDTKTTLIKCIDCLLEKFEQQVEIMKKCLEYTKEFLNAAVEVDHCRQCLQDLLQLNDQENVRFCSKQIYRFNRIYSSITQATSPVRKLKKRCQLILDPDSLLDNNSKKENKPQMEVVGLLKEIVECGAGSESFISVQQEILDASTNNDETSKQYRAIFFDKNIQLKQAYQAPSLSGVFADTQVTLLLSSVWQWFGINLRYHTIEKIKQKIKKTVSYVSTSDNSRGSNESGPSDVSKPKQDHDYSITLDHLKQLITRSCDEISSDSFWLRDSDQTLFRGIYANLVLRYWSLLVEENQQQLMPSNYGKELILIIYEIYKSNPKNCPFLVKIIDQLLNNLLKSNSHDLIGHDGNNQPIIQCILDEESKLKDSQVDSLIMMTPSSQGFFSFKSQPVPEVSQCFQEYFSLDSSNKLVQAY